MAEERQVGIAASEAPNNHRASGTRGGPGVRWLLAAICGVVVVQVVYGIAVFASLGPQMAVRGQFGDIFGGVNALFTGLAFAGVIYTILLQRRELELQREELGLNRVELSRSAQAQTEQVDMLKQSADLSAMSTLVNVYGTMLRPYWDSTREIQMEIGRIRDGPPGIMTADAVMREIGLQDELREMEQRWTPTLQAHRDLIRRLEELANEPRHAESTSLDEQGDAVDRQNTGGETP